MVVDVRNFLIPSIPHRLRTDVTSLVSILQTGKVKETRFEPERGMQLLVEVLTRCVPSLF